MKHFPIILIALFLLSCGNTPEPVSQWRGPNRSGVYNETGLLTDWPAEGPKLLWAIDSTGNGFSSPVLTDNQLFINGETDSIAYLYAYNLTGKLLWKSAYGHEWMKNFPGSRSTPTVVGNLVYVSSGMGDIACFDKKTVQKNGHSIWFLTFME